MAKARTPETAPAAATLVKEGPETVTRLSVCAKQAGFRRAGRAWPAIDTIVDADEFTDEQMAQLLAEPMLVVLPFADDTGQ